MKIAFFGTPDFAVPSLERLVAAGESVVLAVTRPDRPRGRGQRLRPSPVKAAALAHGIPLLQPERAREPGFAAGLAASGADLGVVVAYGQILPDDVLAAPRHGVINVHASLLPRYRGAAPIQRAVMAGEPETGVTMIRLVREMDAGPMLASASRPIGGHETGADLERALAAVGADLLLDTVRAIAEGRARERPQDHALATYAPRLTREDGRIDWTRPARTVHDLVRGLQPWPPAFAFLDASRYLIRRTAPHAGSAPGRDAAPPPGAVVEARGDRLRVACGGGSVLSILEIQPEGRRAQSTRDFLAGRRIPPGAVFRPSPPPA